MAAAAPAAAPAPLATTPVVVEVEPDDLVSTVSVSDILRDEQKKDGLSTTALDADVVRAIHRATIEFGRWFVEKVKSDFPLQEYDFGKEEPRIVDTFVRSTILNTSFAQEIGADARAPIRDAINLIIEVAGDGNCQFTTMRCGQAINEAFALAQKHLTEHTLLEKEDIPEGLERIDGRDQSQVMRGVDLRTRAVEWLLDFEKEAPNGLPRGVMLDMMSAQAVDSLDAMDHGAAEEAMLQGGQNPEQLARRYQGLLALSKTGIWGDQTTALAIAACLDTCIAIKQLPRSRERVSVEEEESGATPLPPQPKVIEVDCYNDQVRTPFNTIRAVWQGTIHNGNEAAHYELLVPAYMYWLINSVLGRENIGAARPLS